MYFYAIFGISFSDLVHACLLVCETELFDAYDQCASRCYGHALTTHLGACDECASRYYGHAFTTHMGGFKE